MYISGKNGVTTEINKDNSQKVGHNFEPTYLRVPMYREGNFVWIEDAFGGFVCFTTAEKTSEARQTVGDVDFSKKNL